METLRRLLAQARGYWAGLGLAALRRGWFLIPEEVAPPAELKWLYQDARWQPSSGRAAAGLLASQPVAPRS